jgi:hypothetical protein
MTTNLRAAAGMGKTPIATTTVPHNHGCDKLKPDAKYFKVTGDPRTAKDAKVTNLVFYVVLTPDQLDVALKAFFTTGRHVFPPGARVCIGAAVDFVPGCKHICVPLNACGEFSTSTLHAWICKCLFPVQDAATKRWGLSPSVNAVTANQVVHLHITLLEHVLRSIIADSDADHNTHIFSCLLRSLRNTPAAADNRKTPVDADEVARLLRTRDSCRADAERFEKIFREAAPLDWAMAVAELSIIAPETLAPAAYQNALMNIVFSTLVKGNALSLDNMSEAVLRMVMDRAMRNMPAVTGLNTVTSEDKLVEMLHEGASRSSGSAPSFIATVRNLACIIMTVRYLHTRLPALPCADDFKRRIADIRDTVKEAQLTELCMYLCPDLRIIGFTDADLAAILLGAVQSPEGAKRAFLDMTSFVSSSQNRVSNIHALVQKNRDARTRSAAASSSGGNPGAPGPDGGAPGGPSGGGPSGGGPDTNTKLDDANTNQRSSSAVAAAPISILVPSADPYVQRLQERGAQHAFAYDGPFNSHDFDPFLRATSLLIRNQDADRLRAEMLAFRGMSQRRTAALFRRAVYIIHGHRTPVSDALLLALDIPNSEFQTEGLGARTTHRDCVITDFAIHQRRPRGSAAATAAAATDSAMPNQPVVAAISAAEPYRPCMPLGEIGRRLTRMTEVRKEEADTLECGVCFETLRRQHAVNPHDAHSDFICKTCIGHMAGTARTTYACPFCRATVRCADNKLLRTAAVPVDDDSV